MNLTLNVNDPEEVVSVIEDLSALINDLLAFIAEIEKELNEGSPDEVLRIIKELNTQLDAQSEKVH